MAEKGSNEQMEQAGQSGFASVDRSRALYERPALNVEDEGTFQQVKQAVDACFGEAGVHAFLRSLDKAGLRVRDFAAVLADSKLGADAPAQYARLSPGDQGLIRELYLAKLEQVDPSLRDRFFRLYAYY